MTIEVKLCGIVLGTCRQRGDVSCNHTVFYGFEPADGVNLPPMFDMTVDFITGTIEHWHGPIGTMIAEYRLLDVLNDPKNVRPTGK